MDFYGLERLVEVGYQHAREEVAKGVASGALNGLAVDFRGRARLTSPPAPRMPARAMT